MRRKWRLSLSRWLLNETAPTVSASVVDEGKRYFCPSPWFSSTSTVLYLSVSLCESKDSVSRWLSTAATDLSAVGRFESRGVKAAKARGKRPVVEGKELSDFQSMWSLKKADLQLKERLSKMRMLESLVAKQAPLADYEEALKKKLIAELIPS
ncbi:hypothetical protein DY000_02037915 [Brassica cretica]|uniref:Uncharacterized protein n=1 Tax=Brassica cretica TaxID=69181 RepID=A0ABQ7BM33_BRACR|nr:hypothetical protein DY000_02037915 [Brassica cretica]